MSTTSGWQIPAPARCVSSIWDSNESSMLQTVAIPPCAYCVLDSEAFPFVMMVTDPILAARSAKLRPAMPLPTTRKWECFSIDPLPRNFIPIDKGNASLLKCGNMKYLRIFLIISVFLCPMDIWGDIYRYVDRDGVVHFTNTPGDRKADLYLREAPKAPPARGSTGRDKAWMMAYAEQCSRANNLDPALIKAIIKAESNGERLAVSPKGAKGMMQLMPFTQKRLNVTDPFDPIENIEGGVRYIKELLGTFGGNLENALAAYNAGPAAVKKYGGIPPYDETRLYVKRVMNYYQRYQSHE